MGSALKDEHIAEAIRKNGGVISAVARSVNLSISGVWHRINKSKQLQITMIEARETLLDLSEGMLIRAIKEGNLTAIIYYLNHHGASRGYGNPRIGHDVGKAYIQNNMNIISLISDKPSIKINRIPVTPGQKIPELVQKDNEVNLTIPIALAGIWSPKRFFIAVSGRGAGKSHTFAREAICRALEKKIQIGCFREVQKSLAYSVYALLIEMIEVLGVTQHFQIRRESIICTLTGSKFIFKGLLNIRDAQATKSVEGIDIAWIEEAEAISAESWELLTPTIRADNSEIWCSLNPREATDIIYEQFVGDKAVVDDETIVVKLSWRDNPWFNDIMRKEKERIRKISEAAYQYVWEGALKARVGQMIKRDWWHRWNTAEDKNYIMKFISCDTAFSEEETADYSVLQVWAITKIDPINKTKYIDLIDLVRGRWSYPKLLKITKMLIRKHNNGSIPLGPTIIEKKASGQSLIQSLEADGIKVWPYDPKTNNKVVRVYAVQQKIFDGSVRIPQDDYAPWVKPFLDEVSSFSDDMSHKYDDQVDAMTQALITWINEV